MFLAKGALKICSKFTGEHPCQSVILIKFQRSFIEITRRHGRSPVNLLHIFRTPFYKKISEGLLLTRVSFYKKMLSNILNYIKWCWIFQHPHQRAFSINFLTRLEGIFWIFIRSINVFCWILLIINYTDYAKFRAVFSIYIKVITKQIIHIQKYLVLF